MSVYGYYMSQGVVSLGFSTLAHVFSLNTRGIIQLVYPRRHNAQLFAVQVVSQSPHCETAFAGTRPRVFQLLKFSGRWSICRQELCYK